jgi:hypothetical protein
MHTDRNSTSVSWPVSGPAGYSLHRQPAAQGHCPTGGVFIVLGVISLRDLGPLPHDMKSSHSGGILKDL